MRACDRLVYSSAVALAAALAAALWSDAMMSAWDAAAVAVCAALLVAAVWERLGGGRRMCGKSMRRHEGGDTDGETEGFAPSSASAGSDKRAREAGAVERPSAQVPMFDRAVLYCSVFHGGSFDAGSGQWGSKAARVVVTGLSSKSRMDPATGFLGKQARLTTPSASSLFSYSADPEFTLLLVVRMNPAPERDKIYTVFNAIGKDAKAARLDFLHLKAKNLAGSDRWVFEMDYICDDAGVRKKAVVSANGDGVRIAPEALQLVVVTREKGRLDVSVRALSSDARTIRVLTNVSNKASEPPPGGFQNTDLWFNRGLVDGVSCAGLGCSALPMDLFVFALFPAKFGENDMTDVHKHYLKQSSAMAGGGSCPYPSVVCHSEECSAVAWSDPASVAQMSDACRARVAKYCTDNPSDPVCVCWRPGNKAVLSCKLWRAYMASDSSALTPSKLSAAEIMRIKAQYGLVDKSEVAKAAAAVKAAEAKAKAAADAKKAKAAADAKKNKTVAAPKAKPAAAKSKTKAAGQCGAAKPKAVAAKPKAVGQCGAAKPKAVAAKPKTKQSSCSSAAKVPGAKKGKASSTKTGSGVANPYEKVKRGSCGRSADPAPVVRGRAFNAYETQSVAGVRRAALGNFYRGRLGLDEIERASVSEAEDREERDLERLGGLRRSWRRGRDLPGLGPVRRRRGPRVGTIGSGLGGRHGSGGASGSGAADGDRRGVFGWMRSRLFSD